MYTADYIKYTLEFHRPAGTSRGTLRSKESWFVRICEQDDPSRFGLGEVSLIPGLSPDDPEGIEGILDDFSAALRSGSIITGNTSNGAPGTSASGQKTPFSGKGIRSAAPDLSGQFSSKKTGLVHGIDLSDFPAVQFGIESALRDFQTGGNRLLYPSSFTGGRSGIPINGLIWMGERRDMLQQVRMKLEAGFRVIKMKVGALDFGDELGVLKAIRSEHAASDLEIRLDANGAWAPGDALQKLNSLAAFGIHSLEQPIPAGIHEEMARVCLESPIPIALDEELIGTSLPSQKKLLLQVINPAYVILKPSLLGGITSVSQWINLADDLGIGWWITSALESNIGLNAIAQWTATLDNDLPQGLGTGSLYKNNIPSPLAVIGDRIHYDPAKEWDLSTLNFRS